MANKTSNLVKRLRSARFAETEADVFRQIVARLPKEWVGTRGFDCAAGMALRLDFGSPTLAPVAQLFKIVNLDPTIPWHWPILLVLIAWAIGDEGRGPGATKRWTSKKLQQLRTDLSSLKSTASHSQAAKTLQKKFPERYGNLKPDYLRKVVKQALLASDAGMSFLPAKHAASRQEGADAIAACIETEIDNEKVLNDLIRRRS